MTEHCIQLHENPLVQRFCRLTDFGNFLRTFREKIRHSNNFHLRDRLSVKYSAGTLVLARRFDFLTKPAYIRYCRLTDFGVLFYGISARNYVIATISTLGRECGAILREVVPFCELAEGFRAERSLLKLVNYQNVGGLQSLYPR